MRACRPAAVLFTFAISASMLASPALADPQEPTPKGTGPIALAKAEAKKQNKRIEIPKYRSENSTTYANPDGRTLRTVMSTEPIRVKRNGSWQPIDTTLIAQGDTVTPRVAKSDLVLSNGGKPDLLTSRADSGHSNGKDAEVQLFASAKLPVPRLSGNRAEYPSAYGDGVDLVVTATPTGFRQQIVIRKRPVRPPILRVPVDLPEGFAFKTDSGKTVLVKDAGEGEQKQVLDISTTMVLDAVAADGGGEPDAGKVGRATIGLEKDQGGSTLILTPDPGFLADAAVTYPVTVAAASSGWWESNPSLTVDTFVNNAAYPTSSDNQFLDRILAGKSNGGTVRWRSYVKFDDISQDSPLRGGKVTNADLYLWNHLSNDCGKPVGSGITARRIISSWHPNTLSWDNQPTVTSTGANTETGAYSPNCTSAAASWAGKEWDLVHSVNTIVQAWADGQPNYGFQLAAANESDVTNWRRYRTTEYSVCTTGTACEGHVHQPLLFVDFQPAVEQVRGFFVPGMNDGSAPTTDEVDEHLADLAGNPVLPELDAEQTRALRENAKHSFMQDSGFGFYPVEEVSREDWVTDLISDENDQEPEPETIPPVVVSTDPAANATNIPVSSAIKANFNEPISNPTFVLKAASGTPVQGALTSQGPVMTFVPAQPLAVSTTYTAEVSGAEDVYGNVMAAPYKWSFTTTSSVQVAGLVAAYGMNEGTGTSVSDSSGKGNNGQTRDTTWIAGKYGQALSFNGTSSWVTVNDSTSLHLSNAATLSAWVKPNSLSNSRSVMTKEHGQGGIAYALYASTGTVPSAVFPVPSWEEEAYVDGSTALPVNQWSHLAATYDGSTARLFLNGNQIGQESFSGNLYSDNSPFRLGGNSPFGEYFSGLIDEVRVYNVAQTATQIQADMNTPGGGGSGLSRTAAPAVQNAETAAVRGFPYDRFSMEDCIDSLPNGDKTARFVTNSFNVCYTGRIGEERLVDGEYTGMWSARIGIVVHTYVGYSNNSNARGMPGTDSREMKAWIRVDHFNPGTFGTGAPRRQMSVHVNNSKKCTSDKPEGIADLAYSWTVGADRVITLTSPKSSFSAPDFIGYCGIMPSVYYPQSTPEKKVGLLDTEQLDLRCDSSPQVRWYSGGGCVVWSARPVWVLNANEKNSEQVAAHLLKALYDQQNTDPKFPGQIKHIPGRRNDKDPGCTTSVGCLTRDTSDRKISGTTAAQNAAAAKKACDKITVPTGITRPSCDEFPFASTHEGVAFAGINYSVAWVDRGDNCSAGAKLKTWYYRNRILERDPFWVDVIDKGQDRPRGVTPPDDPDPIAECDD